MQASNWLPGHRHCSANARCSSTSVKDKPTVMTRLVHLCFVAYVLLGSASCKGQTNSPTASKKSSERNKIIGGGCDGCEIMYVGMPAIIPSTDTSAGWNEKGERLLVAGTVYKLDGKTPAADVVIYYWQTDNNGYYTPGDGMDEKAKRHGHIRGWVKTGKEGKYAIYSIRPAPYPSGSIPAHIHLAVKEPGINNEYYIEDFLFDDDKLLVESQRKALDNRGGSGILSVQKKDSIQIAERNIFLGLNIPGYPAAR